MLTLVLIVTLQSIGYIENEEHTMTWLGGHLTVSNSHAVLSKGWTDISVG